MKKLTMLLCLLLLSACSKTYPSNPLLSTEIIEPAPAIASEAATQAMPPGEFSVRAKDIVYYQDTTGFLAEPENYDDAPGVVLIHEWWGLNSNMKEAAKLLASRGYRVLAVDLYNGEVASTSEVAMNLTQSVKPEEAKENLLAAAESLRAMGSAKVASMGYCFGGGQSARIALEGQLDATVVYYGNLQPAILSPQDVKNPILLIYGDQDTSTTAASAQELVTKLEPYGVRTELHVYPGVGHAFANPSNPGHNVELTKDAWEKTVAFLDTNLH